MDSDSLNPDLNGTACSEIECFEVADVLAVSTLELNVLVGELGRQVRLVTPLCVEHAHLLRMTPRLIAFTEGMG